MSSKPVPDPDQSREDTGNVDAEIARLPLFNIERELVELMDFRDTEDLTSEERETVEAQIAKYITARIAKVDNIRGYLEHAHMLAEGHRHQAQRQARMAQAWEERIEYLKTLCIKAMNISGAKKVQGRTGSLRIQNNGGVRPMQVDEEKVPFEYKPMIITYPVDKEQLRKDLEAGKEIPGAKLLERGVHLRVE